MNSGFRIFRVRHHDTVARLEIARDEMPRALDADVNARIVAGSKALGYQYVSLDLQGYSARQPERGIATASCFVTANSRTGGGTWR